MSSKLLKLMKIRIKSNYKLLSIFNFIRREVSCIDMEMYCTSKYSSYLYLKKIINVWASIHSAFSRFNLSMCDKLIKVMSAASIYGGPKKRVKFSLTHIYVAKKLFAIIVTSPKRAILYKHLIDETTNGETWSCFCTSFRTCYKPTLTVYNLW